MAQYCDRLRFDGIARTQLLSILSKKLIVKLQGGEVDAQFPLFKTQECLTVLLSYTYLENIHHCIPELHLIKVWKNEQEIVE